ncbi:zinc ABC transporter substrate-binding protein [uncultured Gimesia sp.]|jgi:manganese/zinc/iron transport system substrate-binding protein|uniref:metal ABC transporter solute-binding protein, Zn/Mn family n=1 Tax=uncultured Gimesia sp. TaxID=1678688 RepID=UPI00262844C4|nr:zinc ABC transporter substrate-binding protein [uncultured Gimesia sp.]
MRRLFAFALCLSFLAGCQTKETPSSDKATNQPQNGKQLSYPIPVAATVGMVADLVKNVGREYVAVTQIMGSGVDPHMHKASRDDVQSIMNADIVFYSGLMLEGKMADTLIKVSRNKPVFAVTELIDQKTLLEPEDFNGHYDPHVWMDVAAWSQCVDAVKDALSQVDPKHSDVYQKNAADYKKQLAQLHQYGLKTMQSVPEASRILITSHDAFNYFGRAYGLNVQGIQGISTESEAGLKRINELVDMLVAKNIKAVFVESSVSKKNISALIDGVKAQGHDIRIGGELFSDAMGETGTYEGTYVGMLDHNFTTVARALGGTAPEKGMQGKLSP